VRFHFASQGAAVMCEYDRDDPADEARLLRRMREVGKTQAEEEADWKELKRERENDDTER